jgi:hypothetical protein
LALNSGVFYPYAKFISYFIAESGFALPNQRFIAGPQRQLCHLVEKSSDLNTWSPVLLQNTSDDIKGFYRLRISALTRARGVRTSGAPRGERPEL